jgi:hypothetical protein
MRGTLFYKIVHRKQMIWSQNEIYNFFLDSVCLSPAGVTFSSELLIFPPVRVGSVFVGFDCCFACHSALLLYFASTLLRIGSHGLGFVVGWAIPMVYLFYQLKTGNPNITQRKDKVT